MASSSAGNEEEDEYEYVIRSADNPYSEVNPPLPHPPTATQLAGIELSPCPAYLAVKTAAQTGVKVSSIDTEYDFLR